MARHWSRRHIPTKWGAGILLVLLFGLIVIVWQANQSQSIFSRASYDDGNGKLYRPQNKKPLIKEPECKSKYVEMKFTKAELKKLPGEASAVIDEKVGNLCSWENRARDKDGRVLNASGIRKPNGIYLLTEFGCSGGTIDGNDNCHIAFNYREIPECRGVYLGEKYPKWDKRSPGRSDEPRRCEETMKYFAANADQYGFNALLKVTNPRTGQSVVVRSIDRGPACDDGVQKKYARFDISHVAKVAIGSPQYVKVERAPKGSLLGTCARFRFVQ